MQITRYFFKFFKNLFLKIIRKILRIVKFFFLFTNCERGIKEKLAYKKKCQEDAYDIGLTNHCLNDILTMEAVNSSLLDRAYLRSLGKPLYLKYRDREVILPFDKRHFNSFSLKSFGLYLKIQNDQVVRIKMIDHIGHEEMALFTETEQDILSFYSHSIPVNLSKQNKILYMRYILYVEGTSGMNRAVKTLTMKTVFKIDEEAYSINPFGEYEFRYQRRTAESVMTVHTMPKPFVKTLIYQYCGKKETVEKTIKKISDGGESVKKINFYETYKHRKEEFIYMYGGLLIIIGIGLFIGFSTLPYFENMNPSVEIRGGLPIRSVYSLEPELYMIEPDKYINAVREMAVPYSSGLEEIETSGKKGQFFSSSGLEYFDKSNYLKTKNYLTQLDNVMYFHKVDHQNVMRRQRIHQIGTNFLSLND